MSNSVTEKTTTCSSCEYRYPATRGICPMCGTEPLRPLSVVSNKSGRASRTVRPSSSDSQQKIPRSGAWRLIPVVALIALLVVTSFFYKNRKNNLAKESGSSAPLRAPSEQVNIKSASERIVHEPVGGVEHEVAERPGTRLAASEQIKVENAAERHIVRPAATRVQQIAAAKPVTAATVDAAKVNPVELWKAVKRGSVNAEVALANLYLEGEAVPQNCEQAHMLLSAAAMKGSKAADNLLKSSYAERCQ